jgi:hypothetical protein
MEKGRQPDRLRLETRVIPTLFAGAISPSRCTTHAATNRPSPHGSMRDMRHYTGEVEGVK